MDLGLDIADDLAKVDFRNRLSMNFFWPSKIFQLKKDMDKLKKSGMDMDMNIEQMDWVEDNKKVWHPFYKACCCFNSPNCYFRSKPSSSTNRRYRTMKNTTAVLRNPSLVEQFNKQWYQDNFLFSLLNCGYYRLAFENWTYWNTLGDLNFCWTRVIQQDSSGSDTNVEIVCCAGNEDVGWIADILFVQW